MIEPRKRDPIEQDDGVGHNTVSFYKKMSSGYTSQPATKGKVILKTSAGDLEIELWPKEAPKSK